ncbi:MAG TPA: ABC transporter substrate-binding protein [Gaiellales bacterium]|nr:ABC transporter substrate-binding protein [Gaiellales bacterium]
MRTWTRSITSVLLMMVALAAGLGAPAGAADAVKFKLDFSPVGYHAMFYSGVSRGVYERHGLSVDIIPGTGSYAAVMDMAAGKVDFAFADSSTLALAALQAGVKDVKIVGMVLEVTPYSILYLRNHGISKPADLAGKTMANFQGSGVGRLFRSFARINGVDASGIKEIISAPPTYLNPLVVGQADFSPSTVNQTVNLREPARQAGNDLAEFRFIDYGMNMHGAALIANTQTLAQRQDLARRFVRATLESVQWTAKNPEAAVDELLKSNPQLKKDRALAELRSVLTVSIPRGTAAGDPLQLGWTDAGKMARTVELVRESFDLTQHVDPATLYTNEYVTRP